MINQWAVLEQESIMSEFVVPNYYRDFTCKGGECRHSCCADWGVTIPMKQYFYLLGLSCTATLREKLDRTFRPLADATPERYAEIVHLYSGDCPLHMDNGYCMLQYHCGEDVLPSVCRYYPRGPRTDYAMECACSNSCEKTLELLFSNDNKVTFETLNLKFKMPLIVSRRTNEEKTFYQHVRSFCFSVLQNRDHSLPTRLRIMGAVLSKLDNNPTLDLSFIPSFVPNIESDIPTTYGKLMNIAKWFIETNSSLAEDFRDSEAFYLFGSIQENYDMAKKHFDDVLPNQEILFEKVIINHLFFAQFPFRDQAKSFYEEFVSVCGIYLLVRYLAIHHMLKGNKVEDFIDIVAKLFRVIAHTRFERNILILLQGEDAADFDTLAKMIQA